jgi:hypothetical protein
VLKKLKQKKELIDTDYGIMHERSKKKPSPSGEGGQIVNSNATFIKKLNGR